MDFDLLVIGGGINGASIARDAQGRGLKTLLVEKDDLASGTSSASSKLIHGGLRYLETYEFRLVREALREREVLLRAAPHIIWPMRFYLPHSAEQRPRWMIRAGLFLYDNLAKRELLPGSRSVRFAREFGEANPINDRFKNGFVYSDCWVQDARLVVLMAQDLMARGGSVLTRTEVTSARRSEDQSHWAYTLRASDGSLTHGTARAVVNAAGPWADKVDSQVVSKNNPGQLRHVRGSHIVVPKVPGVDHAFLLQHTDGRVIFVIPYEQDFTLIGTTDVNHESDPKTATCTDEEASYLCAAVSRYLATPLTVDQIVWRYSGVRPLLFEEGKDASKVSRDYSFSLEGGGDRAALLSVYGGKLTACRELAEDALKHFEGILEMSAPWTDKAVLPGGDIGLDFEGKLQELQAAAPGISAATCYRWLRNYGSFAFDLATAPVEELGDGVYTAEIKYLQDREFAKSAQDVLWRRTKLGLKTSSATQVAIAALF